MKTIVRKIVYATAAVALAFSLVNCGNGESRNGNSGIGAGTPVSSWTQDSSAEVDSTAAARVLIPTDANGTQAPLLAATRQSGPATIERPIKRRVRPGDRLQLHTEGLTLTAGGDAVKRGGEYSVTPLHAAEVPPMPEGMTNVTAILNSQFSIFNSPGGYRLLPSGEHFSPAAELRVAYDPALLPPGMTPDDIYTSYYDTEGKVWTRLERIAVDTAAREIVSLTTHFTDFVNEVLKLPEMPEASAFVPTDISKLEAASPANGIRLPQPPEANSRGDAEISYPLDIPAGRHGMQPNLTLTYSSGNDVGWLGAGWDISLPSISVDTRWGVPRYDPEKESEVYMLNGEQLVAVNPDNGEFIPLPHRTSTWHGRLDDKTRFVSRVDEAYDSVVRRGDKPWNYWWEVWDRTGTVHRYGHYTVIPDNKHPSTLHGMEGNIGRWCLTESEDADGNMVLYLYDTIWDAGVVGSSIKGVQIYPAEIHYTVHTNAGNTAYGPFKVVFYREDNDKARKHSLKFQSQTNGYTCLDDKRIPSRTSGRYGFKEVTASWLSHISVYTNASHDNNVDTLISTDTLMKVWHFGMIYGDSTGYRPLLTTVRLCAMGEVNVGTSPLIPSCEMGEKGILYRGTDMDATIKFRYYRMPENPFGGEENIGQFWSAQNNSPSPYSGDVNSTEFKNSLTEILDRPLSTTALGMGKGMGWNVGGGVSMGLGFSIYWTESAVGGNYSHGWNKDYGSLELADVDGDGLPDKIFRNISGNVYYRPYKRVSESMFYFDAKRPLSSIDEIRYTSGSSDEVGLQLSLGVSATGSRTWSRSHTTSYLSDVNGDGLPDMVTDGGVLYNDIVDDVPVFSPAPHQSTPEIGDTVRTSTMPCGYVIRNGILNDSIYCETVMERIAKHYSISELDELVAVIKTNFTSYGYTVDYMDSDSIYGRRYVLKCDSVKYNSNDINPTTEAVKVWIVPHSGRITVRDSIRMIPNQPGLSRSRYADGVNYCVQYEENVQQSGNTLTSTSSYIIPRLSGTLQADNTVFIVKADSMDVTAGDMLMFRLQSRANNAFDRVDWRHQIKYSSSIPGISEDTYGKPKNIYRSDSDIALCGNDKFCAPENGYVKVSVPVKTGTLRHSGTANTMTVAVRHNNSTRTTKTVASDRPLSSVWDSTFAVTRGDSVWVELGADGNATTWSNVTCKPYYRFIPVSTSDILDTLKYHLAPRVEMKEIPTSVPKLCNRLFGPLYRGWGQFTYNATGRDTSSLIALGTLKYLDIPSSTADSNKMKSMGDSLSNITNVNALTIDRLSHVASGTDNYNPLDTNVSRWLSMRPDIEHNCWVGYNATTTIGWRLASNSIIPEYCSDPDVSDIEPMDCPAPAPTAEYPRVSTHARVTESRTDNVSVGVGVPGISASASYSEGWCATTSEFTDLNGDRYPDLVGKGATQYTMPWGGLDASPVAGSGVESSTNTRSNSHSANIAPGDNSQEPKPEFFRLTSKSDIGSAPHRPAAVGAGEVDGNDIAECNLVDLNGDGLPDKVHGNGSVEMNVGYRFLPEENWSCAGTHEGSYESGSGTGSLSLPFNKGKFSIGGGISYGLSDNRTDFQLMDINGDGLPDRMVKLGSYMYIRYNMGNGYWSDETRVLLPGISTGRSFSENANASVTAGFTWGFAKITGTVNGCPMSRTFSCETLRMQDLNGDGLPDIATSGGESDLKVRYNMAGKGTLLKKVENHMGGTCTIDYAFVPPTYDSPQGKWVMSSCRVSGGSQDYPDSYSTFEYRNPRQDRYERLFMGFDTAITVQHLANSQGTYTPYRVITNGYENRAYHKRGRLRSTSISTAAGARYDETLYNVRVKDMRTELEVGDADCPLVTYPDIEITITNHYEGQSAPLQTKSVRKEYDQYRNIKTYINFGDTNYTGDELNMDMDYKSSWTRHQCAQRTRVVVHSGVTTSGTVLRQTEFTHDSKGRVTNRRDLISGNSYAETEYGYDNYGNVTRVDYPANNASQRLYFLYTYDAVMHCLPVGIDDSYNRNSSARWDHRYSKPKSRTDVAGKTIYYKYDALGRTLNVTAPDEAAANIPYTWKAQYDNIYARTYHYDILHPNDPIETITLCDGWGRTLRVKRDAAINGTDKYAVSGEVVHDALGRAVAVYDPVEQSLGNPLAINNLPTSSIREKTAYDILDRATTHIMYAGVNLTESSSYTYQNVSGRALLKTSVTDANSHTTHSFSDAHGRTLLVTDAAGGSTAFTYDALGQLLTSTDPDGFTTTHTYDLLGRRTRRVHPDAGTEIFNYDPAGNMTSHTNAKGETVTYHYFCTRLDSICYPRLPQNKVFIEYGISDGRPWKITDGSGRRVLQYDALGNVSREERTFALPGTQNTYTFVTQYEYDSWGRMLQMTYPDGEEVSYAYNSGGSLVAMTGLKNNVPYTYISNITYDLKGDRTMTMYGNGTRTVYGHDNIRRMNHMTTSVPVGGGNYQAVQDITYTFDGVSNIIEVNNSANSFGTLGGPYKNIYTYDVLDRMVTASLGFGTSNPSNPAVSTTMGYSDAGRLCQKTQQATSQNLDFAYSSRDKQHAPRRVCNHTAGLLHDLRWEPTGCLGVEAVYNDHQDMNSFRQLHWTEECRLSDVVDGLFFSHYGYDSDGTRWLKMVGRSSVSVVNGAPPNCMASLSEVTLYASPYLVATNTGYTKHYYAGTERVAARVGNGGLGYSMGLTGENSALTGNANRLFAGCLTSMGQRSIVDESPSDYVALCDNYNQLFGAWLRPVPTSMNTSGVSASTGTFVSTMGTLIQQSQVPEAAFYYHSDHLGGAAWITDGTGQPIQHLQYHPFGEPYVNQRAAGSTYSERYTFTGKERDAETGYSDFGARYMDHDLLTSFMSVDPLTDKYPNISPYAYCAWNPVKLVDDDGRKVKPTSMKELDIVKNTLPKDARSYVSLDKDGYIDKDRLSQYSGNSLNYSNLLELVSSEEYTVEIRLANHFSYKDKNGNTIVGGADGTMYHYDYDPSYPSFKDIFGDTPDCLSTGETGLFGKTLFPDLDGLQNSTNNNIIIILNSNLSNAGLAETYSHEANGHALLYIRTNGNHDAASHHYDGMTDTNYRLMEMIISSKKETIINMQSE